MPKPASFVFEIVDLNGTDTGRVLGKWIIRLHCLSPAERSELTRPCSSPRRGSSVVRPPKGRGRLRGPSSWERPFHAEGIAPIATCLLLPQRFRSVLRNVDNFVYNPRRGCGQLGPETVFVLLIVLWLRHGSI